MTTPKIDPLTNDNYVTWKIQMWDILSDLDLIEHVETPESKTEADGTVKATGGAIDMAVCNVRGKDFVKKDRSALTQIRLRVTGGVMTYISGAETAYAAWEALRTIFEPKTVIGRVMAERRMWGSQMEEGGDLEAHIRSKGVTRNELHSMGREISDSNFAVAILVSLPSSWDSFIQSIDASDDTLRSANIIARILDEDRRVKARTGTESAFAMRGKSGQRNIRCYNCHQIGHISRDCSKPRRARTDSGGDKANEATDAVFAWVAIEETREQVFAIETDPWIADSGATSHVGKHRVWFTKYTETPGRTLSGVTGTVDVKGIGEIRFVPMIGGIAKAPIILRNVLTVPDDPHSLLSLAKITGYGDRIPLQGEWLKIKEGGADKVRAEARKIGSLYQVQGHAIAGDSALTARNEDHPINWWHRALCHFGASGIWAMVRNGMVLGLTVKDSEEQDHQCTSCIQGMQHATQMPKQARNATKGIGDLIVSDVWGPSPTKSIHGNNYYVSFTDVHSRFTVVMFLKEKSEVISKFKQFNAFFKNQTNRQIKRFRADNGGEYTSNTMRTYLLEEGIIFETTAPDSPAQNGIAERLNRTLAEHARAILIDAKAPKFLWEEAVRHVAYIKNRTGSQGLADLKTPFEMFWGKKPDLGHAVVSVPVIKLIVMEFTKALCINRDHHQTLK